MMMSDSDITIFAPTDGSIQEFLNNQPVTPPTSEDKDGLRNLLLNHIVEGKIMSADIEDGMKVKNLANNLLQIQANQDGVTVGGAKVGKVDMPILNSIVHELQSVISVDQLQDAPSLMENEVTAPNVGSSKDESKSETEARPTTSTTTTTTSTTTTTTTTKKKETEVIARTVVSTSASPSAPLTEEVYSQCFEAKGCFGMPVGCVEGKACKAMVTFHPSLAEEGKFDFVLQARDLPDNHYVALGLSHDMQMGNDLVFACSKKAKVCHGFPIEA